MKAIKKEESCALSSACCSVMQELGQIDINEDPAKALKEANALQARMGPACGNQDDGMAMQKCMGPPAAEMLAGRGVSFFAASAATCDFSLTTGMDKDMKAIKKEESCALSSACCSVMQELGQIDINEDPAKALKEANALQERMGPACGNQDDGMAMQKCMGPKPAADILAEMLWNLHRVELKSWSMTWEA